MPITSTAHWRRAATFTPLRPMSAETCAAAMPNDLANHSRSFVFEKTRLTVLDEKRRARHRAAPPSGACDSRLVVVTPLDTSTSSRSSSVFPDFFSASDLGPPPMKYRKDGDASNICAHSAHGCRCP